MEGKPLVDGKAKSLVAYHEVGHAVCGTLTEGHDPVQKVTLVPRGQARGLTWFTPGEDTSLISKQQLFARIVGALGGRAAEQVIFGAPEVTTGASSDLQQARALAPRFLMCFLPSPTQPLACFSLCRRSPVLLGACVCRRAPRALARRPLHARGSAFGRLRRAYRVAQVTQMAKQMVINYGFSNIGPWSLMDQNAQQGDMIMRMMARNSMSEALQVQIDKAVQKIAGDAYEVALKHVRDNREAIDEIVTRLLEVETLPGKEFRTILGRYATIPEARRQRCHCSALLLLARPRGVRGAPFILPSCRSLPLSTYLSGCTWDAHAASLRDSNRCQDGGLMQDRASAASVLADLCSL